MSQAYSSSKYFVETLKPRSNIWIWQMFVIFSSQFSPSTSSHTAVCCWTSCSSRYAVRHLHLTHCFFLSFLSHLSCLCKHTHTHKDRILCLMTDGKSTIVQRQSLKTQTHTPHVHTNTETNTTSLSSCPFVSNPLSNALICFLQLRVCISLCVCVCFFTLVY